MSNGPLYFSMNTIANRYADDGLHTYLFAGAGSCRTTLPWLRIVCRRGVLDAAIEPVVSPCPPPVFLRLPLSDTPRKMSVWTMLPGSLRTTAVSHQPDDAVTICARRVPTALLASGTTFVVPPVRSATAPADALEWAIDISELIGLGGATLKESVSLGLAMAERAILTYTPPDGGPVKFR